MRRRSRFHLPSASVLLTMNLARSLGVPETDPPLWRAAAAAAAAAAVASFDPLSDEGVAGGTQGCTFAYGAAARSLEFSDHGGNSLAIPSRGYVAVEETNSPASRRRCRRPACPNFLGSFANVSEAESFSSADDDSGCFLGPGSLSVIMLGGEEGITLGQVEKAMFQGAFARVTKLVLLARQDGKFRAFARRGMGIKEVDVWNGNAFELNGGRFFSERLRDFGGRTLRVATFDYPPFTTSRPTPKGHTPLFDGIEMKTFSIVSEVLNFTYKVHEPKTGIRFAGVGSDLKARVADIGVSHLFYTLDRIVQDHMSYTSPINTDHYSFFVPQAKKKPQWMALHLPLESCVWLGLLVTFAVCIIFALVYVVAARSKAEITFNGLVFYYFGAFIENSIPDTFKIRGNSLRLFIASFLVSFLLLTTWYKGSLISHLLSPIWLKPLETIEDVINSDLKVFSLTGILYRGINEDSDPKLIKLASKSYKHSNIVAALTNTSEGRAVLTESEQMCKYRVNLDFIDREGYPTVHTGGRIRHFDVAFYGQVGSPYTVPISRVVDGLRESGIGGKILSDALTLGGTRRGEEQGRRATMDWEGPLTLEVLQGAYLLHLLLVGLAFAALGCEVAANRFPADKKNLVREMALSELSFADTMPSTPDDRRQSRSSRKPSYVSTAEYWRSSGGFRNRGGETRLSATGR